MGWFDNMMGSMGGGQNPLMTILAAIMAQSMNKENKAELEGSYGNPYKTGAGVMNERYNTMWGRMKEADEGVSNNPAVRKMRALAEARAGKSGLTAGDIKAPGRYSPADTGANVFTQQSVRGAPRFNPYAGGALSDQTITKPQGGVPGRFTDTGGMTTLPPKGATPGRTQYTPGTPYKAQRANAPRRHDPYTPHPSLPGTGGTPDFTPNIGATPKRFDPYTPHPSFPGSGGQEQGVDPALMMKMLAMAQGGQQGGAGGMGMEALMNSMANRFGARDMRQGNVSGQLNPMQLPTGFNPLYQNMRGA